MKTHSMILVLFAILFTCGHTRAQDDLPYRSFQAFKNDTIRYLDYNFTIRKDQYVDKTVGDLFRDLELPVVHMSDRLMIAHIHSSTNTVSIGGMNLVIRLAGNGNEDRNSYRDSSKDYYIRLELKTYVECGDFYNALNRDKRNDGRRNRVSYCTPQVYELLKDCKIKRIESNSYLFEDRRKLLESHTSEDMKQLQEISNTEKENWRKSIRQEKQVVPK